MTAALPFAELLERAGARLGRGRRWWCPRCDGRTPALAVDRERELFYCHRCGWRGGRRALEEALGIEPEKLDAGELRQRKLIREEAGRFAEWARRKRIAAAELLRTLDRAAADWREAGRVELQERSQVSERTWARLHLAWVWNDRAEARWNKLCNFEGNAPNLYAEFVSRRKAA